MTNPQEACRLQRKAFRAAYKPSSISICAIAIHNIFCCGDTSRSFHRIAMQVEEAPTFVGKNGGLPLLVQASPDAHR